MGRINLSRKGSLDENSVNAAIRVEFSNQREQVGFGSRFGQDFRIGAYSQAFAGALLHSHVNLRRGIFAYTDKNQTRLNSSGTQPGNPVRRLGVNLFCYGASIDEVVHLIKVAPQACRWQ